MSEYSGRSFSTPSPLSRSSSSGSSGSTPPSSSSSDNNDNNTDIGASSGGPKTLVRCNQPSLSATPYHYYNQLKQNQPRPSSSSSILYQLATCVVQVVTYFAIMVLTALAITCLFCLFLAIRFVDDMLKSFIPGRVWSLVRGRLLAVDWPGALTRWSTHLTRLAEWEKTRRASLNPSFSERFANLDGDRLHAFLFSLTGLLGGLTSNNSRWRWHQQQQEHPATSPSST